MEKSKGEGTTASSTSNPPPFLLEHSTALQPQSGPEVFEARPGGEGGGSENRGFQASEEVLPQEGAHLDGGGRQGQVPARAPVPCSFQPSNQGDPFVPWVQDPFDSPGHDDPVGFGR